MMASQEEEIITKNIRLKEIESDNEENEENGENEENDSDEISTSNTK